MAASTEAGKMLQNMMAGRRHGRHRGKGKHSAAAARIMALKAKAKSAPLGEGSRFAALKAELANKPGVTDPGGLAAYIGRKKLGAKKFNSLAAKGRKG